MSDGGGVPGVRGHLVDMTQAENGRVRCRCCAPPVVLRLREYPDFSHLPIVDGPPVQVGSCHFAGIPLRDYERAGQSFVVGDEFPPSDSGGATGHECGGSL